MIPPMSRTRRIGRRIDRSSELLLVPEALFPAEEDVEVVALLLNTVGPSSVAVPLSDVVGARVGCVAVGATVGVREEGTADGVEVEVELVSSDRDVVGTGDAAAVDAGDTRPPYVQAESRGIGGP